ncbi:DMT family transporter, partial [Candidatus Pacearchaeota archaeon]|nr:DMT family transporter [Candidatus Pacearchaeota archaeon]
MGILSEAKAIYQEYRRQSQAKKTAQKQAKQQAAQPQQPQQTGSGGSNFGTKILVKLYTQHKSKFKWILLVLAIVLAGIIYQFGWESVKSFIWRHILRILAISLFFIALAYAFIKDEDKRTASIVAIPYIIWFIDSSTYFGPQYQGFKFEFFILTETNWIAVVTSSLISAMLIFNIFNEFFKKDMGFIVSMFFFAGVSYASGKLLPNLSTTTIYSILPIILAAFGIILFYVFRRQGFTLHPESLSYLFMILVFSFFWVNWKWTASTKAILHVGYILMFCLGYLGIVMGVDKTKLYAFTSLALVADFFVYNIFVAENFNPPIIVIITSILAWNLAKSYFASWNMFSIIALFTLIWFVATPLSAQGLGVDIQAKEADSAASPFKAVTQPISDFFKKVDDVVKKRSSKVAKTVEERLDIATGGYTSIVEKNQYESLGVYFSDPRAGEPVFYADEPVVVWATIQSKTYQDPVVVKFSCYRKEQDKPRINGEANPAEPFLAFQLEENDVECRFSSKSNTISSLGAVPITLSAEYNFATNAYLKAYFIDKDTYRALTRENIDPRQQFGIQDLTPQTVVTNGPMDIVINAGPIIAVADIYKPEPTIVVSVRNRQEIEDKDNKIITQWEGKIKELKELIILAPPDVEILTSTCNHPFEKYDEKKCITSCDEFVLKKCNEACSANDQNCQKECTVLNDKCKSECNDLFRVDQGQGPQDKRYNAYYLTDIKTDRASYTDIGADRHRTFFCRINPLRGVLDKTPITTRYFRVRARYDYFLENTVEVNIEPYIGSLGSVGELIDNYAVPLGMEKSLVLALMVVESSMRHCKNGGRECSPDQVIASRDSSGNPISVGVM